LLVNVTGHDADLALSRGNNTGTVWTDKSRLCLSDEPVFYAYHVLLRNALSDADNEGNFSIKRFHDCCCCPRWRDINDRSIWLDSFFSFQDRVENRYSKVDLASFSW
jgi:hypothetical protein